MSSQHFQQSNNFFQRPDAIRKSACYNDGRALGTKTKMSKDAADSRNHQARRRAIETAHQGSPRATANLFRGIAGAGAEGPAFDEKRNRQIAAIWLIGCSV